MNKLAKQDVWSRGIQMCGMPQWNRLRAGLLQEECGLGGVGWSGRSTDGRISSVVTRHHHLGVAVRRHRHSEHRTAVDHALAQLLEHSVGLLHRKHAEHWRNYLHTTFHDNLTHSHTLLITNSNVISLRSWRVAHGKQPLASSLSTLTALHVSMSLTRWRLDWRFLWFSRQTLHFTQCSTYAQVSAIRLINWNGISMIRSKTNEKLSSKN